MCVNCGFFHHFPLLFLRFDLDPSFHVQTRHLLRCQPKEKHLHDLSICGMHDACWTNAKQYSVHKAWQVL
jgi:hypothetical protein